MTDNASAPPTPPSLLRDRIGAFPGFPLAAAILFGLLAIGFGFWALGLREDLQAAKAEVSRLESEIAQIRANADATTYRMTATPDGPPPASGTAYLSITGSGVLAVANLPVPQQGMGYQLWFFPTGGGDPIPGGFITIDATGQGFALLAADVGPVSTLGLSLEPISGSTSPTGPMLMTGSLGGARG